MMKFVLTSDIHLHPFPSPSKNRGADRLQDGLNALEQTMLFASQKKCPWVCLGDLKQTRGIWNQKALAGALDIMEKYEAVPKLLLAGNHDGAGMKESAATGMVPFQKYATTISQPDCRELSEYFAWGEPLGFWPWQPTLEGVPKFLDLCKKRGARVIFGHAFIRGSKVGKSDIVLAEEGVPQEVFGLVGTKKERVFDIGFFGDVHKRQTLGDPKQQRAARVIVPGDPYAQNWGELEPDKGALYVEVDGGVLKALKVLPVLGVPRFRVIELGRAGDFDELDLENIETYKGDFVRILVQEALHKELLSYTTQIEFLQKNARHFQIVVLKPEKEKRKKHVLHSGMSHSQMLTEYVRTRAPVGMDKRMLAKVGEKLLDEN